MVAKKSKKQKQEKKAAKKADAALRKDKKSGKKANKPSKAGELATRAGAALANHPAVAEIVAATLVGAAAALSNPKKARALANAAGENLEALGKEAADKGSALWALALEVGRKSLETLDLKPAETPGKRPATRKPAAARKPAATKRKAPAKKDMSRPKAFRGTIDPS